MMERKRRKAYWGLLARWFVWLAFPASAFSQQFNVTTLLENGPQDKRINIVFLSEGYTAQQLSNGDFRSAAQNALDGLLQNVPFREYRNYFNAYAINVPSNDSGTDHPATASDERLDSQGNPILPAFFNDTYFNTTFDGNNIHRLLIIGSRDRVNHVLQDNLPQYDIVLMLVNHPEHGGSGGTFAVFSQAPSAVEVAIHEVGHSFAGLGDEYETPNPNSSDIEEPNTTRETRRSAIKWRNWISNSTPIPTPETAQYANAVGLFEGAHYHSTGWYRPKLNCKMRELGIDFCEVCSETILLSTYGMVDMIESISPSETSLSIPVNDAVFFQVDLLSPSSHQLASQWYLDGVQLANETAAIYHLNGSSVGEGFHTVRVEVTDATSMVRTDPSQLLRSVRTWDLQVSPTRDNVDVALVIDRSSSMSGSKFDDARRAASQFTGFMQTGDNLAVVSFGSSANIEFGLRQIISEATKQSAQAAISAIPLGGGTTIGGGMQVAQRELDSGDPNHPQAMVLLSDGHETATPNVVDILPQIPTKTDIYTIGLGANADQNTLRDIALQTGGSYHPSHDPDELQKIYLQIQGKLRGQQSVASKEGQITQGQTVSYRAALDGLTSQAVFSLLFQGSDVDLELVTPGGSLITPGVANSDPNIEYVEGSTYDFYTISSPQAGEWTIRLIGVDVPVPEKYFSSVQVNSKLKMNVFLDKNEYSAGEVIVVSASIKENGSNVTGAQVTAEALVPASSLALYNQLHPRGDDETGQTTNASSRFEYVAAAFSLFDDGRHSDGSANDGVYANRFSDTANDGSYTFEVEASGNASQGGSFQRQGSVATIVTPAVASPLEVLSPSAGDVWEIGTTHRIKWTAYNTSKKVRINVERDTGFSERIVGDATDDGSYAWTLGTHLVPASDYRIRVTSVFNAIATDLSDYFTISGPPVNPTISGYVRLANGTGIESVRMDFSGGINAVLTGSDGFYSQTVTPNWTGTVTPVKTADCGGNLCIFTFNPPNRAYNDLTDDLTDQNFTGTPPVNPTITVTNPGTGSEWVKGVAYAITWTWSGVAGGNVRIRLYKGGALQQNITTSTPNDGSRSWTPATSLTSGGDYQIRVTSTTVPSADDFSDNFAISDAPFIAVSSPTSGNDWRKGSTNSIRWDSNITENVNIYLYRNSAQQQTIQSNKVNTGNHDWTVPQSLPTAQDYRIRITSAANDAVEGYSGTFSISELEFLEVLIPDAGDIWKTGATQTIEWRSNAGGNVRLRLYRSGALTQTIASSTPNDLTEGWDISATLSAGDDYQIRVTSTSNSTLDDFSEIFVIVKPPFLELVRPATGDNWETGSTQSIEWNSNATGNMRIRLYKDGAMLQTIASSTPNDSTYPWTVPESLADGDDYEVRITSVANTTLDEYSDAFTISRPDFIEVVRPGTGDIWQADAWHTIEWNSNADGEVKIDLYSGANLRNTIANATENDGAFDWYIQADVASGDQYHIRVGSTADTNMQDYGESFQIDNVTSVARLLPGMPSEFALRQNYPNPFNPETEIQFELPKRAHVQIIIYSLLGTRIVNLVDESKAAGVFVARWDGRDGSGHQVASGIYVYRMRADEFVATRRLLLVR